MQPTTFIYLFLLACLASCVQERRELGDVQGYIPKYLPAATAYVISAEAVKPTTNPGKIYAYNQYVFQVEQGQGIHVIDNSVPQNAAKISFISIPGCTELAIKSNYLYTNNVNDLIVINLANLSSLQIVNRQKNAFPQIQEGFPPLSNVYYECPDESKGIIVGWELAIIKNPKCRR